MEPTDNIEFDHLPELKPCPFCGNQFEAHEEHAFIETQGTKWGQVNCCNAEVRTGYGPLSDWIEDAIETWNTRPIEDALHQRIEELEAENEEIRRQYANRCLQVEELQRKHEELEAENERLSNGLMTHEAVNAFWRVWKEVVEPHKHGVYESTWMAFRAAIETEGKIQLAAVNERDQLQSRIAAGIVWRFREALGESALESSQSELSGPQGQAGE